MSIDVMELSSKYANLLMILADPDQCSMHKNTAIVYEAFKGTSVIRSLAVAQGVADYTISAATLDSMVRAHRRDALGKKSRHNGNVPAQEEIEEVRTELLSDIDKLVAALQQARAAYDVLYREPDGVDDEKAEADATAAQLGRRVKSAKEQLLEMVEAALDKIARDASSSH